MHNKLIPLLTLALMLIMAAPSYAQGASTEDDGGGIPIPVIVAAVAVILALVTRNMMGLGSRRGDVVEDFDEDEEPPPRKERRQKKRKQRRTPDIDDDPEAYLIERDQVWDEDGYSGEEDVGF